MHPTLLVMLAAFLVLAVRAADFDIKDAAEFSKIVPKDAKLQKLAGGMQFVEGPVWIAADGGYLVFSDIPADELKKWTAKDGVTTFRKPSHNANGNSLTPDGLLITCEHSARRVTRTEKDGTVTVLADSYDGKKLNSPNDLVMKSDGTIYFSDPPYGVPKGEKKEQPKNFVFCLNPKTKELKTVADDFDMPNGLCFSPDEKKLYIADSGKPHHIRVFDVKDDGTLAGGKVFCVIDPGLPDGIRCDAAGRIFSSAGDGVQIFTPAGALIGKILVPESPANLCFGGDDKKTLFITARKSLYSIALSVAGR
ncbi:MAG: SMP-30/gluconolactonase/LRE family protein [Planctomycetota bacterium]|nr:SMP-30/gluconolactonase/LRE family protein [Planctomycetota bacterium]